MSALVFLALGNEDLQFGITFAPHTHLFGPRLRDGAQPRAHISAKGLELGGIELAHEFAPSLTRTVQAEMPGAP